MKVPNTLGTRNNICYYVAMAEKTSEMILSYISRRGQASGKELVDHLETITDRGVRKQLKSLLEKGKLRKIGTPPRVYYLLAENQEKLNVSSIAPPMQKFIDERSIYISPAGEFVGGWKGFQLWCKKTNQDPIKTAKEYLATQKRYDKFKRSGVIDGTHKLKLTFKEVFLDRLFYIDFYSIERFGKTKLGQMLLYAKQSQNRTQIRRVADEVGPTILALLEKYDIDGVVFIPPTVKREVQFMRELERHLHLPSRVLKVEKIKTEVVVPQKTLTKLADRIENARQTIIVRDKGNYRNILLIDDAVGSGATLNETAGQIRNLRLTNGKIIGVSITGSFKGFDVISEV